MSAPFSVQGVLNLPGAPGLPADPLPFGLSAQYDSLAHAEYNLPASSGSKTVDFGTLPSAGAKGILVTYDGVVPNNNGPIPPVLVTVGGAQLELSSGGFLCFGSPTPVSGITAMTIAYTGAGKVRVWLLG